MRSYLEKLMRGLAPWSAGGLIADFLSADQATTSEQLRAVYGPECYERLAGVKKTYDPLNMFRMNHNITPA